MKNRLYISLLAVPAVGIGFYPLLYFLIDRNFGLLQTKEAWLLEQLLWNISFYLHIVFGGLALLIGWIQFVEKWRMANPGMHRLLGKMYILSVWLSSISGLYIAFHATGGLITSLGFISLGIIWLLSTHGAYLFVRRKQIQRHKNWMIVSYAACFAAVTLRIWLPLLIAIFGEFLIAYQITAWICWVPNLMLAYYIIHYSENKSKRAMIAN